MSEWRLGFKVAKLEQRIEVLEQFVRDVIQAPEQTDEPEEEQKPSR